MNRFGALPPNQSDIGLNAAQLLLKNMGADYFDEKLVGMSASEAYKWVQAADLQSNLAIDEKTGYTITIARIAIPIPGFRTFTIVNDMVTKVTRE